MKKELKRVSAPKTASMVSLEEVEVGEKLTLDRIYFDQGSYLLREESYEMLEKLYDFMKSNPDVLLQIQGHTDDVGKRNANIRLSKNRALVVYNFLVGKGIQEYRLSFIGYGPLQPIAANDTEENRSKNRRVDVLVIGK